MKVKIQTMLGDIVVRLYDETPIHRDNFIKLVKEGYYDGTLFHRVIKNFMIQGGDARGYKLNSDNILVKYSHFWEFCLIFASNNAKTGCTSA